MSVRDLKSGDIAVFHPALAAYENPLFAEVCTGEVIGVDFDRRRVVFWDDVTQSYDYFSFSAFIRKG